MAGLAGLLTIFSACSARQDIMIHADGSGEADIRITLDPAFSTYLTDLAATLGTGNDTESDVFDLGLLRRTFEEEPGLTLLDAGIPTPDELHLLVGFDSLATLFALRGSRLGGDFRFERTDTLRRLAVRIDRRTIENLVSLVGIDSFVSESLLPPDGDMTISEYRDYLVWALEEYEQDRPIATVLNDSAVETHVTPDGRINQVRGGLRTGSAVVFRTPLLEAVTTRVPLEYSVIFTP